MKKICFLLLFVTIGVSISGQSYSFMTSKNSVPHQKDAKILGRIGQNIYLYVNDESKRNLQLISYNIDSLKICKKVSIKGYMSSRDNSVIFGNRLLRIFIVNECIYMVWAKTTEIAIQAVDKDFMSVYEPKKIIMTEYKILNNQYSSVVIEISPDREKIALGFELGSLKSTKKNLYYKLINSKLEVLNNIKVELPYSISNPYGKNSSSYKLDNNGILYFDTEVQSIPLNSGDIVERAHLVGNVMPEDSKINTYILSLADKNLVNFDYVFEKDEMTCFGLYEFTKSTRDNLIAGVFHCRLNAKTLDPIGDFKFSEFQVNDIVYSNLEMTKAQKKNYSLDEYNLIKLQIKKIGLSYSIEECLATPDGGYVLCLTKKRYFSKQSFLSGEKCFTSYYGLFFVKVSNSADIQWITCISDVNDGRGMMNYKAKTLVLKDDIFTVVPSGKEILIYQFDVVTGKPTINKIPLVFDAHKCEIIDGCIFGVNQKISKISINN
jgi:hypothetical protein